MKKSLIALAVLAAAGAVSAQTVTLSGKLGFAYAKTTTTTAGTGATADVNGLGVTDGNFTLTAVEDLGGGMKMKAAMDVQSRGRTTAVAGRDASLTLSGGFGAVLIGAIEAGNGILGLGGAGAPVWGLDNGVVLGAASNTDILRYYTPDMSGFKGYVSVLDGNGTATVPGTGAGAGGMQDTALSQDATQVGVTYGAGPVAVAADYTNYGLNAVLAATPGADNRLRVSGSYNLGVAKLGLGYESRKSTAATNNGSRDWLIGVSAPFGATTVGLNYARRTADGVDQDATGIDFGVQYSLSKRTLVAFQYQDETAGAAAATIQGNTKKYRVKLLHAF